MKNIIDIENQALEAFNEGDYKRAKKIYYNLIQLSPKIPRYYEYLGECHQRLGERQLAENCKTKVKSLTESVGQVNGLIPRNSKISPGVARREEQFNIKDYSEIGKFWEIFGFSDDSFNSIQLGNKYAELLAGESPEDSQLIDIVFSVLNAPISRQIYKLCREAMGTIERTIGEAKFKNKEREIWHLLWAYCSSGWREPTPQIIEQIKVESGISRPSPMPRKKSQQEVIGEVVNLIKSLDSNGLNKNQIAEALTKQGIPFTIAMQFVSSYYNAKKQRQSKRIKQIVFWGVAGLIIWGISASGICENPNSTTTTSNGYTPATTTQVSTTATITGYISRASGVPVTYAEVYLFVPNTNLSYRGTRVDSTGMYSFSYVTPGTYEIYVTTNPNLTSFTGYPNATITVIANQHMNVPRIYIN